MITKEEIKKALIEFDIKELCKFTKKLDDIMTDEEAEALIVESGTEFQNELSWDEYLYEYSSRKSMISWSLRVPFC